MADDDIRDDGTVVCAIHGMRYDPALTDGCIRCPRSVVPGKRSAAPARSAAPRSSAPPPSTRLGSSYPPPRTAPSIPFEPANLDKPYVSQQGGPVITILEGPARRTSRRGLIGALGALVAGGAGAAAWFLRPEGATDWLSRVTPLHYGPALGLGGSIFVPSAAAERACPLLLLLGHPKRTDRQCARYAKHCEEHGSIAACSSAFGNGPAHDDSASAALFIEAVHASANVDSSRAVLAGFDSAGEAACRLAVLEPSTFAGAILECCGMASWRDVGAVARNDVSFFLFTRSGDPAREAMLTMKDEMQRKGLGVGYSGIAGGHEPMERDELDPAFAWIQGLSR